MERICDELKTDGEKWKKVIKPWLKEKNFFYVNSQKTGNYIVLTYKKEDLFAIIEFFGGEVSIELTEGKNRELYLEELELLLG